MSYLEIAIYVIAGVMLIIGFVVSYKEHEQNAFGKAAFATVMKCTRSGGAPLPDYEVLLSYKVNGKKYKATVHTKNPIPMNEGTEVSIGYNVLNPAEIKLHGDKSSKIFFMIAALLVILVNFIIFVL